MGRAARHCCTLVSLAALWPVQGLHQPPALQLGDDQAFGSEPGDDLDETFCSEGLPPGTSCRMPWSAQLEDLLEDSRLGDEAEEEGAALSLERLEAPQAVEVSKCDGCTNRPMECWAPCNKKGLCANCDSASGTRKGACCRRDGNQHNHLDPPECKSVPLSDFTYHGYHMCVLIPKAGEGEPFGLERWEAPQGQVDVFETCSSKYPERSLDHMAALFREHTPGGRVFVALNLHQNVNIMFNLGSVLAKLAWRLGPRNVFVSIFESWSTDYSWLGVQQIQERLQGLGVRVAAQTTVTGANELVNRSLKLNRIHHMAMLRNAALDPLYELDRRGEHFDKVLFVNDILVCEGDMWRLLALQADMACGLDFKRKRFYDSWAYDGRMPTGCVPEPHANGSFPEGGCVETPVQVKSCWSGMAAINAGVFYRGVRFRAGVLGDPNDCRDSECSLLTRDMWRLNFRKVLVDPTVQVAYEWKGGYALVHNMSEQALFDNRRDFIPAANVGDVHTRRCCPLSEHPGERYIDLKVCRMRQFSAKEPPPYTKEWLQQFEVHWYEG